MRFRLIFGSILGAAIPSVALAHPDHTNSLSFATGFIHPVTGIDHLLAMFAVGLIAWQLGGRARWLAPVTFVSGTVLGGLLAVSGLHLVAVESVIALSVLAFGLMAASKIRPHLSITLTAIMLFAIFHGHAHISEMPARSVGTAYGLGFLIATASLHAAGLGFAYSIERFMRPESFLWLRGIASVISVAGLILFIGTF